MSTDSVYIVFTKEQRHWWTCFLHSEINHCYILKPFGDKLIVCGKSLRSVDLYTIDSYDCIIDKRLIIKAIPRERNNGLFMLNTCVGNIKQYLGIRNPFIWTPYQLLKRLNHGRIQQTKSTCKDSGTSSDRIKNTLIAR